jgi:hypothetical protein
MEEEIFFTMLFSGGAGLLVGYLWGKARGAKQFFDRWGDALLMRTRPQEVSAPPPNDSVRRIASSVDRLSERFELMEQRLDFAERLLERERLPASQRSDLPR